MNEQGFIPTALGDLHPLMPLGEKKGRIEEEVFGPSPLAIGS